MLDALSPLTDRRTFVGLTAAAFGTLTLTSCGGSADSEVDAGSQDFGAMDSFEADQQFTATEPFIAPTALSAASTGVSALPPHPARARPPTAAAPRPRTDRRRGRDVDMGRG